MGKKKREANQTWRHRGIRRERETARQRERPTDRGIEREAPRREGERKRVAQRRRQKN